MVYDTTPDPPNRTLATAPDPAPHVTPDPAPHVTPDPGFDEQLHCRVEHRRGLALLRCASRGPTIGSERDALDLAGEAFGHGSDMVVIPVERLDPAFFRLGTRVAGEILHKFSTYRVRLVVIGDISAYLSASSTLRDFVRESNRGRQAWFVADLDELDARLQRVARP